MFWKKRDDRAFIDGTRVGCPLRGIDVTIEDCKACGKLRNIIEDDLPYVICAGRRIDLRAHVVI